MKVKLNFSLPTGAVLLSMMAVSVYAQPSDSHHPDTRGNMTLENPLIATPVEKAKVGPEATDNIDVEDPVTVTPGEKPKVGPAVPVKAVVENQPPTSETTSDKDSLVSDWLEARATEEADAGKSSVEEAPFPMDDEDMGAVGGGWCNNCGCWVRHGCDPNGNCNIMHIVVCDGMGPGCYLHAGSNCISTG